MVSETAETRLIGTLPVPPGEMTLQVRMQYTGVRRLIKRLVFNLVRQDGNRPVSLVDIQSDVDVLSGKINTFTLHKPFGFN